MNRIYLFAILIAVASANFAVDIGNTAFSRQTMKCLSNQNVSRVVLEISNEMGHINQDFLSGYIFAKDAGISTIDATVMVNDTSVAAEISTKIATALPTNFNGTIWLQIINAPQLWTQDISRRIPYLEALVLVLKQNGVTAGVSADANTWVSIFGSQRAGSDTLKAAPVWYANDNEVQSFDDFSYAGFGTWTQPTLKTYQNSVYLCGTMLGSLDYYEDKTRFNSIYLL